MTIANSLRFFLIFTLISSLTIVNLLQAEQPAVQTSGRQSPTAVPVSVLDGPPIVYSSQANAPDVVLQDREPSPKTGAAATVWQRPANNGRMNRQVIRSMDIHDRPYRLGHFYGNTVRRRN